MKRLGTMVLALKTEERIRSKALWEASKRRRLAGYCSKGSRRKRRLTELNGFKFSLKD